MKKITLYFALLSVALLTFSCSKENVAETTSAAGSSGKSYGDPILVTRDAPLMLKSPASVDDADALWVDKVEATDVKFGDYVSRNGLIDIASTVTNFSHWTNMENVFGDPGFNVFTNGTFELSGRRADLLEDYWVAILVYIDLPGNISYDPAPLVTAVSSEGYLDCNFVFTGGGSSYLSYRSYDRNQLWDLADGFYDFRILWLKRENDILYPSYSYPSYGQWIRDVNQEYQALVNNPSSWGQPIPYQTWATNRIVFGDTSEYESSIGHYPGDNEGIRIGSIYLFPKP